MIDPQIIWTGKMFDRSKQCGIAGMVEGQKFRMAMRFCDMDELTPQRLVEAAGKIEFAIRSQLQAAENKAEVSKYTG